MSWHGDGRTTCRVCGRMTDDVGTCSCVSMRDVGLARVVECRRCGWLLVHAAWTPAKDGQQADEIGCCPQCLRQEEAEYLARLRATQSRTRLLLARGFGPAAPGVDVFRGMRED
jgi:hypothetical protein